MQRKDFIFLNVPGVIEHALRVIPPTDKYAKVASTYLCTEVEFLRLQKLIKPTSSANEMQFENLVLRLSDLTEEGQDFVMSGATSKWLAACDRKSNAMLAKGASEEERLAVYADPKGLISRLEKFRKERAAKAN
jgi:hypothetical protein